MGIESPVKALARGRRRLLMWADRRSERAIAQEIRFPGKPFLGDDRFTYLLAALLLVGALIGIVFTGNFGFPALCGAGVGIAVGAHRRRLVARKGTLRPF